MTDRPGMVRGAAETRIMELALQLLDACRAEVATIPTGDRVASADDLEASVLSMAVQSVFMADLLETRGADGFTTEMNQARFLARFTGLGAGVGACIGQSGHPIAAIQAGDRVQKAMAQQILALLPDTLRHSLGRKGT